MHGSTEERIKSTYAPTWSHSTLLESIWWGIPCVIIVILAILAWRTSHSNPYRKIPSNQKPMVIQQFHCNGSGYSLPKQNIATLIISSFQKIEVEFQITSDAPMNAFYPAIG